MDKEQLELIFPEVVPEYLIPELEPKYKLRRFDRAENRYYYLSTDSGIGKAYISNTSITSQAFPMSFGLKKYIGDLGYENSQWEMGKKALTGTAFHVESFKPFHDGYYSFAEMERRFWDTIPIWYKEESHGWIEPLKRDLLCFFLFMKERVKKIHAIECPLKSDEWGVAGQGDLICDIEFNKGIVTAMIDLKSGKKGFWPEHELQLKLLQAEWNETYPERPVTHLFNLAPVDFKTKPSYKLQNQTDALTNKVSFNGVEIMEWEARLLALKAKGIIAKPAKHEFTWGRFERIEAFDPENHILIYQ